MQQAIERLLEGRTVFMIAHRLSTIQRSDQILVLEDGRIVERGTHQDLLAAQGLYHRLYELQFSDEAPEPLLTQAGRGTTSPPGGISGPQPGRKPGASATPAEPGS